MCRIIFADTSVLLNFVCSNNQEFLLNFAHPNPISIPEAIAEEMHRKLAQEKFEIGKIRWHTLLNAGKVEILPDDMERLLPFIRGYAGFNFTTHKGLAKNLGEFVAIAHCLAIQEEHPDAAVFIIIDDGDACDIIRKRQAATPISTEVVLLSNVKNGHITTRGQARTIWEGLRAFDSLLPFEYTRLNAKSIYKQSPEQS